MESQFGFPWCSARLWKAPRDDSQSWRLKRSARALGAVKLCYRKKIGLRENFQDSPHRKNRKIAGFRCRFSLKPIHWTMKFLSWECSYLRYQTSWSTFGGLPPNFWVVNWWTMTAPGWTWRAEKAGDRSTDSAARAFEDWDATKPPNYLVI